MFEAPASRELGCGLRGRVRRGGRTNEDGAITSEDPTPHFPGRGLTDRTSRASQGEETGGEKSPSTAGREAAQGQWRGEGAVR